MLYGCMLLYITLIYVRPAEIVAGWATIPFVQILTVISAVIAVFSLANKPRRFAGLPQDKLLLAFWVLIAISATQVWFMMVFTAWMEFMPVVFCYFLMRAAIQTRSQLRGVILLLVFLNVFLAINGIVQYQTGMGLGDVQMTEDRIYGTGIFNDPNDLGMTFVLAIPFVMFLIAEKGRSVLIRISAVAMFCIILVAMYFTNSRGAVIGLSAALLCYAFLRFKKKSGLIVGAVLVGLVALAAPSRAGQMDGGDSSSQSRIQSWAQGWNMLKSHPIRGVGYGQYAEINGLVAHNSFVHTFAELGLPGAFCLVGMFYWYFKGLRAKPGVVDELGGWRRALIASGVGTLMCAWFLSRQYVAVMYILLALGASASTFRGDAAAPTMVMTSRDAKNIAGLTLLGIVLVYISIRTLAIWGG